MHAFISFVFVSFASISCGPKWPVRDACFQDPKLAFQALLLHPQILLIRQGSEGKKRVRAKAVKE
eukprot:1159954-Pelagomonas_calceolata.AAC.11